MQKLDISVESVHFHKHSRQAQKQLDLKRQKLDFLAFYSSGLKCIQQLEKGPGMLSFGWSAV